MSKRSLYSRTIAGCLLSLAAVCTVCHGEDGVAASVELEAVIEQYRAWGESSTDADDVNWVATLPEYDEKEKQLRALAERLNAIDCSAVSETAFDQARAIRHEIEDLLLEYECQWYLMPLNGVQDNFRFLFDVQNRYGEMTIENFDRYEKALEAIPPYIDNLISRLRYAVQHDVVPPAYCLADIEDRIQLLQTHGMERLEYPFGWGWDEVPELQQTQHWTRFRNVYQPNIELAYGRLATFVRDEYMPAVRNQQSTSILPADGDLYARIVRNKTTIDIAPEELHTKGLDLVEEYRREALRLMRRSKIQALVPEVGSDVADDELFDRVRDHLRNEDRYFPYDPDGLIEEYRALCNHALGRMPKYFLTLPTLPCAVYGVDDELSFGGPAAFYKIGSFDDGHPSVAFINNQDTDEHPTWYRRALIYHEAIPGHHLEQVYALNDPDPQLSHTWQYVSVYSEGWAMYMEVFSEEIELYSTDLDRLGAIFSRMLRACRLVIDTGINAKGWTVDQAEQFLRDNTPFRDSTIVSEVRRAIIWPGHGLTYIVGMEAFLDVRARATKQLGEAFDIREFHHAVLSRGQMTLPMLHETVDQWIEREVSQQTDEEEVP